MAMTRLSDPTPRMTLPRALLSEALRLARSPLTAVHLVCGLAAGLACGEYFSVTRWDPALGADAYAQFLGALMPLMSAIVCGLAVDEERAAGRLANLTAVPSRGRAVAAKLLALAALGAGALAVALGVFGAVLAVAGLRPRRVVEVEHAEHCAARDQKIIADFKIHPASPVPRGSEPSAQGPSASPAHST